MLIPVILSGGAGTRLWPVSRRLYPKPFMTLPDGDTLIGKTLDAETIAAARAIAPRAAALTGLDPGVIARFCETWASSPRTTTLWSQGVNQSSRFASASQKPSRSAAAWS